MAERDDFIRKNSGMDFSKITNMIIRDLNDTSAGRSMLSTYTRDNVANYLRNPEQNSKNLVKMSDQLYRNSPHFRRLVNYYANMPLLDYNIEPIGANIYNDFNMDTFKKSYFRTIETVEKMELKHEMKKALKVAWKDDAFYGYEISSKDSFFYFQLPNEQCKITSIEDGVYNFSFDFQYFDQYPHKLDFYPEEFTRLFNEYRRNTQERWKELDSQKTVCIKVNENYVFDFPPFANLFGSIFDIEDYKSLKMATERINSYKFFVQKIPIRDKSNINNDFMIDLNHVSMFHNKTANTLPEEIGIISTPFDVEAVNFTRDRAEKDNVQEAERGFYSSAGTSQLLFNGDQSSNANLSKSVNVDEQDVFALNRQIERVINRKIKFEIKGANKFKIDILDTTLFNQGEYQDKLLKSAQYGVPVKMKLASSLGMSPSSTLSNMLVENEILNLAENFIPLESSHTQSADDNEGGRPLSDENDLDEKGEEQRERGDNDNR